MSLKVTRGTVTFVCQLHATGYPRRTYFSYTYYEIGEWVHCRLEEPIDKCCLYYLTLCDLFAVARSHASWPRWMDMCWMYSVKFFLASFVNRMFYCFPCLCLYVSFLFIIIIYLLCVMLVYSIYCIVVSLLLFSPPNRWTLSCKYFLPPCVD